VLVGSLALSWEFERSQSAEKFSGSSNSIVEHVHTAYRASLHTLMPRGRGLEAMFVGAAVAWAAHVFTGPTYMGCVIGRCSATSSGSVMTFTPSMHLACAHTT